MAGRTRLNVRRWTLAIGLGGAVAGLACWRKVLTRDGAVAAAVIGAVVFAKGGLRGAASLLAFFVSSSVLSRVAARRKHGGELVQAKGAQRDAWQVLANGAFATLSIAAGQHAAFVGALAAAGADTWATELGLLSRGTPRLITTLKPVPPGTSGGITLAGTLASAGGALVVGIASRSVCTALVAGMVGSLLDSLLGATLQATYWCDRCASPTEEANHRACDGAARLVKGLPFVNNDTVNFIATGVGAALGLLARDGD